MDASAVFAVLTVLVIAGKVMWDAWRSRHDPGPKPDAPLLYRTAAAACGLTEVQDHRQFPRTVDGWSAPFRVRLCLVSRSPDPDAHEFETGLLLTRIDGHAVPLTLRRERRDFLGRKLSAREIEIGDKEFDDDFHVTGPHSFVRALLDGPTRRLLRTLLSEIDVEVAGATLRGTVPVRTGWPPHEFALARLLSLALEAGRRLERPRDVAQRLADNARLDPVPEVRLQNLLTLVREFPEHPATDAALMTACADASDWIRVRAATALGERGRSTLLEVAGRDDPDDDAAAQAIDVLGRHLAPERTVSLLARALRARQMQTARACLAALGNVGDESAIGVLSRVMGVEEGDLAVGAADALGATGSPAAEPALVAALEREIPDVRVAAARALGRAGTAGAVLPLKDAESRYARDARFSGTARQAIAEIQSRVGGAPGQLSLAAAEAGTLSLADDERGRLSLKRSDDR